MRGATTGVTRAKAAVRRAPEEARVAERKTDLNIVYYMRKGAFLCFARKLEKDSWFLSSNAFFFTCALVITVVSTNENSMNKKYGVRLHATSARRLAGETIPKAIHSGESIVSEGVKRKI